MRNLSLLLLALVCGCASLPPSELEAIRAAGVRSRERLPRNPVGGAGSLAQAQAFVATGEAEEIDYWRFAAEPTSADRDALRTALDGAGGRAVQILGPDEKFVRRAYAPALQVTGRLDAPVLLAGTDRALLVDANGHLVAGTWANGARQPLCAGAFEVTADKQIVWSLASATDVNLMTAFKLEGGD